MYFISLSYRSRLWATRYAGSKPVVLDIPLFGRLFMGRELPHFDRHVRRFAAWSRSRGNLSRYGISTLRVGDIDNPVAQQEFLRLRKHTISDRHAIFFATYQLGFP